MLLPSIASNFFFIFPPKTHSVFLFYLPHYCTTFEVYCQGKDGSSPEIHTVNRPLYVILNGERSEQAEAQGVAAAGYGLKSRWLPEENVTFAMVSHPNSLPYPIVAFAPRFFLAVRSEKLRQAQDDRLIVRFALFVSSQQKAAKFFCQILLQKSIVYGIIRLLNKLNTDAKWACFIQGISICFFCHTYFMNLIKMQIPFM